jgi:hypothetical protein
MPSIGMVGFMVGDDIHLVMWESVGDVIIPGITQGGCIVVLAIVVLCHTNRELFCLGASLLASHAYVPPLGEGMYPAPIAGCSLQHP